MTTEATRIRRLQTGLLLSCAVSVLALVVAVWALERTSDLAARPAPSEIAMEGMTLSKWGMEVENHFATSKGSANAGVKVQATDSSAYLVLGARRLGVTIEIPANSNTVKLETFGNADSTLEIDTDTGAWTLARKLYDAKANIIKEDRVQVVAPIAP
jgi:hypothetical protein